MITVLAAALSLTIAPAQAAKPAAQPIKLAGLLGRKKRWVELPQEVQVEYDYAPTVGRKPEPAADTPFKSVRYLTPEQRAEPIIVEPAPRIVVIDQPEEEKSDTGGSQPDEAAASYGSTVPNYSTQAAPAPSQPSSLGQSAQPQGQPQVEPYPSGPTRNNSPSGSTAFPDYGAGPPVRRQPPASQR